MKLEKEKTKGSFKSLLEAAAFKVLKKLLRGKTPQYEGEKVPYIVPARAASYIPDFILTKKDGTKLYLEIKGYLRPHDRVKMRLVKRHNPDLDIRLVFGQNNLVAGTKLRYSDWAKKNGFPFAIGEIPNKWVKE
jgi:predicted nuclease of restriction endonuclease-like RecB superfamily